jgi:hypothetical protein
MHKWYPSSKNPVDVGSEPYCTSIDWLLSTFMSSFLDTTFGRKHVLLCLSESDFFPHFT